MPNPNQGPRLTFVRLPPPTGADILKLTENIARRLIKVARRHFTDHMEQLLEVDAQQPVEDEHAALFNALSASLRAPVRLPPSPPLPGLKLDPSAPPSDHPHHPEQRPEHGPKPRPEPEHRPLCASVRGFSLHAGTAVSEHDRDALERLCRYGLRAPFSVKRFSLLADGRVRYELRRPWPTPNGAAELKLKPLELLRRLAALIPTPYTNLVRYHGVFANRSRYRTQLPPPPPSPHQPSPHKPPSAHAPLDEPSEEPAPEPAREPAPEPAAATSPPPTLPRKTRLLWAALLRRVFNVDALRCAKCSAQMIVLAFLSDPPVVRRILMHLKLPVSSPPVAPARLPQQEDMFSDQPLPDEMYTADEMNDMEEPTAEAHQHDARGPPP